MNITADILKKIIKEEIEKKRLSEVGGKGNATDEPYSVANFKIVNRLCKHANFVWKEEYSDEDPSMESLGPIAWNEQVELAVEDLEEKVSEIVAEVYENLTNGNYYRG